MNKFMTATQARKQFYTVIQMAEHPGVAVTITHEGSPKVVIMSFEQFETWEEMLEIQADPALDHDVRQAVKEMKAGKLNDTVSLATVKKRLKIK